MDETQSTRFHPQVGLYFGESVREPEGWQEALEALVEECSLLGIRLIAAGCAEAAEWLSEVAFSNSASVVWLKEEGDCGHVDSALTSLILPGADSSTILNFLSSSVAVIIRIGEMDRVLDDNDGFNFVDLKKLAAERSEKTGFSYIPKLIRDAPLSFSGVGSRDALKQGYELMWRGYPSSRDDAQTTVAAMHMFRRAVLSGLIEADRGSDQLTEEALVRSFEAAGSFHYYQRADYAEALRYFAKCVDHSDPKSTLGRFVRALAAETHGLLAFDLGIYDVAETAARRARELYKISREDSSPETRFYFDHTLEGLRGDAEVYRAYRLSEQRNRKEASEALQVAKTAYSKALEIQPLWAKNATKDTFQNAMESVDILESRLATKDVRKD